MKNKCLSVLKNLKEYVLTPIGLNRTIAIVWGLILIYGALSESVVSVIASCFFYLCNTIEYVGLAARESKNFFIVLPMGKEEESE